MPLGEHVAMATEGRMTDIEEINKIQKRGRKGCLDNIETSKQEVNAFYLPNELVSPITQRTELTYSFIWKWILNSRVCQATQKHCLQFLWETA